MEKELEDASNSYNDWYVENVDPSYETIYETNIRGFKEGAKWMSEKLYTEEEVKDLIEDWTKMSKGLNIFFPREKFNKFFQEYKKK